MVKRGATLLVVLTLMFFLSFVYAEESSSIDLDEMIVESENFEEELSVSAGAKPGDFFYGLDKIFDRFSSNLELREERIAEMRELALLCGEGDESACDGIEEAYESYKEHADEFERKVSPEEEKEAKRSSRAIRGTYVREIAQNVPPTLKDEFVKEILAKEKGIDLASELVAKISMLCRQLSEVDPKKYDEVCNPGDSDEVPEWERRQHEELTKEQKEEARKFFKIMSQCFETTSDEVEGFECECEEIGIKSFSTLCVTVVPLEDRCNSRGDEEACKKAQEKTEGVFTDLPKHLQDVMFELEGGDEGHDFFPMECKEAGANSRSECALVMVQTHAPEECVDELEGMAAEGIVEEEEFRKACDRIMMEIHAPECLEKEIENPHDCEEFYRKNRYGKGNSGSGFGDFEECKEEGIENPDECNKFLFKKLPEEFRKECDKNGIFWTPDCISYMKGSGKYEGIGFDFDRKKREGGSHGISCREIEDSVKRLECYDSGGGAYGGYENEGLCIGEEEFDERVGDCLYSCPDCRWNGISGDSGHGYPCTIDVSCEMDDGGWEGYDCSLLDCQPGSHCEPDYGCVPDDYGNEGPGGDGGLNECSDGCSDECPGADGTDCVASGNDLICECYYEDHSSEEDYPQEEPDSNQEESSGTDEESTSESSGEESSSEGSSEESSSNEEESTSESNGEESSSSDGGGDSSSGESDGGGDSSITGDVVYGSFITGNAFLDYFYDNDWWF